MKCFIEEGLSDDRPGAFLDLFDRGVLPFLIRAVKSEGRVVPRTVDASVALSGPYKVYSRERRCAGRRESFALDVGARKGLLGEQQSTRRAKLQQCSGVHGSRDRQREERNLLCPAHGSRGS